MEVDHPIAVTYTFSNFLAGLCDQADALVSIEHSVRDGATDGGVHAKSAVSGLHRSSGAILQAHAATGASSSTSAAATGGGSRCAARTWGAHFGRQAGSAITFAEITDRPSQHLVQRQAEGFSFDVPQRHIQRALSMRFFAAGRIKPRDVHLLPYGFDVEGIFADERAGTLFECVARAAFADAC